MSCCPVMPCVPQPVQDWDCEDDLRFKLAPCLPDRQKAIQVCAKEFRLSIPKFDYDAGTWLGASIMVVQFNFAALEPFFVTRLASVPSTPSYVACIRYRIGTAVYRWKLWENVGERLYVPLLTPSDKILRNFVIEIWTVEGSARVRNRVSPDMIATTQFNQPERCLDYGPCDDIWFDLPADIPVEWNECVPWADNVLVLGDDSGPPISDDDLMSLLGIP